MYENVNNIYTEFHKNTEFGIWHADWEIEFPRFYM